MVWLLVVVIAVVVLVVGAVIGMYNSLVRARHNYENAYAQIDVQLARRHDLIPNLVETAKAYMRHEQNTLVAVTNARAAAIQARQGAAPGNAPAMAALAGAENALTGSIGQFFAVSENYPELHSSSQYAQLRQDLIRTEEKITASRRFYNLCVEELNGVKRAFPGNIVGRNSGEPREKFSLGERRADFAEPVSISL